MLSESIAERRKKAINRQAERHELRLSLRHELEMMGIRNTGAVLKFFSDQGIGTCAAFKEFGDTIRQAQSEEAVEVIGEFEQGMQQSGVTKMDRAKLALWALGADGPRGRGGAGDEASDEERQTRRSRWPDLKDPRTFDTESYADAALRASGGFWPESRGASSATAATARGGSSATAATARGGSSDTSLAAEAEATSLNATSVAAEALAPGEFEC